MERPVFSLLILSLILAACPEPEEPQPPVISGAYNLVAQQQDSDCLPEVASSSEIFGFMDEAAAGIPVMTMEISQTGGDLSVELGPSGCVWTGIVDAFSSVTLGGDCHDADIARSAHLTAQMEPYGDGWEFLGSLHLAIDTVDSEGNAGPDGATDCDVMADLEGTGQ